MKNSLKIVLPLLVVSATSSQAVTVFTDTFNYTESSAFIAEGGWTTVIDLGSIGTTSNSGIMYGNPASGESALEYNYATTLSEGDTISMDANVDRGSGYSYGMRISLWDGVTRVEKAGGVQLGVGPSSEANYDLVQVSYTVTNADIAAGLNQVIFKYSNEGDWSQTNDVTFDVTSIPEPSSTVLIGVAGIALVLRRQK